MTGSGLSSRLHFESCSPFRHHHELASSGILDMRATLTCRDLSIKILIYNNKVEFNWPVAYPPTRPGLQGKCFESSCVLCSAVAYCCGAVAPCAIAALLGRFLPRLGPLVHSSGPFFFWAVRHSGMRLLAQARIHNHDREYGLSDVQLHIIARASRAPE